MSEDSTPHLRDAMYRAALARVEELSEWADENGWQVVASDLHQSHVQLSDLVEQLESLRQAEEAAQVQDRVGNEGDADAIRRDAIHRVLGLGLYADSNPAINLPEVLAEADADLAAGRARLASEVFEELGLNDDSDPASGAGTSSAEGTNEANAAGPRVSSPAKEPK